MNKIITLELPIIKKMKNYQNLYNGIWEQLDSKHIFRYNFPLDDLYNLKKHCKHLHDELKRYNMVNHKIPFTTEESVNIGRMLESNDEDTLELCKQILLTKLNE